MPVLFERFSSTVLRHNPLGDPGDREVAVVVPEGDDPTVPRPAVWLLSGFSATGRSALRDDDPWTESFPARVGRLQREGRIGPMRFFVPDCFTRYGGSQYLDSPAVGLYQTYLVEELVPWAESRFRTTRRAVVGKSSGGFGALRAAMDRPGAFHAVACHSGDMGFEYCYLPDFTRALSALDVHGGLEGFLAAFDTAQNKRDKPFFDAMNLVCMAACYSPDAGEPRGIALPFELPTGRIREEVWARWLAHDPVRRVEAGAEALRALRLVYLDCGKRDEFGLSWGGRQLAAKLRALGVAHVHQEFDGGHFSVAHRYDVSLPLVWEALR